MPKVQACFWFDVEDYITPESDDALKALLDIFEERGARGTWKLVGEKYRVLRSRQRKDIIEALHRQDVGYHTDNHSQHPTISEYARGLSWQAGADEFAAREWCGFEELRQEFGAISCYGQPGGAWAPQAFDVMRRWGIPMYLDEGRHVGLGKRPFWFQNVLTAFNLQENCVRVDISRDDKVAALREARRRFDSTAERLKGEGGLISLYYHPCEFATSEFWDGVNFSNGRNTPRAEWKGAPLLSREEAAARLRTFAELLDLALSHADVEVVDAEQLAAAYQPHRGSLQLASTELARIATDLRGGISCAASSEGWLSPAQVFSGLAEALTAWAEAGEVPRSVELSSPLGPARRVGVPADGRTTVADVVRAARQARAAIKAANRLPDAVWLGATEIGPGTAFAAMSQVLAAALAGGAAESVAISSPRLLLEDQVGADEREMWGWTIFPRGFSAPDLLELTRLQTWTMKPATPV